jgi:hypothetical protein
MKQSSYRLFLAGFIATFAMSILMYPSAAIRITEFDYASLLSSLLGGVGWWFGFLVQALIGIFVVPTAYRFIFPYLPGKFIVRGLIFSFLILVFAMSVASPLMGFGFLGSAHSSPPLVWLALGIVHLTYGLLLAAIAGNKP